MAIRAVFFDVGETIVDETREWGTWADWLGVPRHTFSAAFGAIIATGRHHHETFQQFKPGFDVRVERERRAAVGEPETFGEDDLYPDARACLAALRDQGVTVGLAGNQTDRSEDILHALNLPVDVIGTPRAWGVSKPAPEFFARLVAEARCPAAAILYVGDRLDNDIAPAQAAGLRTAHLRRGPWAYVTADPATAQRCLWRLDSLVPLPELVRHRNEEESR